MIDLLQTLPWLMGTVVLLLGLCIGSFLNVVAWRLPLRMEHEFRLACHEQFGAPPLVPPAGPISLLRPGSHCPACQTPIKPWHNLPVLGWLWLRGRCAACAAPISVQYPLVELATGLLSLACWWVLGSGPALAAALLLTWVLVALTVIDLKTMYLPDDLTLPLLWLGLLLSVGGIGPAPGAAILGAAAGYLVLWSVFWAFKLATGKEGMGYGDFKLLAALGAWLGWQLLPLVILLSAVVGAAVGLTLMAAGRAEWSSKIPFGPYLAGAGWIALLWGEALVGGYLAVLGPAP